LLSEHRLPEAAAILEPILRSAEQAGRIITKIEALAIQSLTMQEQAGGKLLRALQLAEPEQYQDVHNRTEAVARARELGLIK
jgi:hypothetical protein